MEIPKFEKRLSRMRTKRFSIPWLKIALVAFCVLCLVLAFKAGQHFPETQLIPYEF